VYRYGSHKKQVLTIDSLLNFKEKQLIATQTGYTGGCPSGICHL